MIGNNWVDLLGLEVVDVFDDLERRLRHGASEFVGEARHGHDEDHPLAVRLGEDGLLEEHSHARVRVIAIFAMRRTTEAALDDERDRADDRYEPKNRS